MKLAELEYKWKIEAEKQKNDEILKTYKMIRPF